MEFSSSSGISFISLCSESYVICYSQKGILLHRNRRNIITPKQEASTDFHFKKLRGCTVLPATMQTEIVFGFHFGISRAATSGRQLTLPVWQLTESPGTGQPGHKPTFSTMSKEPCEKCSAEAAISANLVAQNINAALPSIFFFIQIIVSLIYGSSQHPNRLSQQSWEDTT